MTIRDAVEEAHDIASEHGWWDREPDFGLLIALCHSELSEAIEEYRGGHSFTEEYVGAKNDPKGIPSELADVCIRIFDLCGAYGIDLEKTIETKMEYNKNRPYRHGNKLA